MATASTSLPSPAATALPAVLPLLLPPPPMPRCHRQHRVTTAAAALPLRICRAAVLLPCSRRAATALPAALPPLQKLRFCQAATTAAKLATATALPPPPPHCHCRPTSATAAPLLVATAAAVLPLLEPSPLFSLSLPLLSLSSFQSPLPPLLLVD
jgi:hypothetical protein